MRSDVHWRKKGQRPQTKDSALLVLQSYSR